MKKEHLEQMRAHNDEGGKFTNRNAVELLGEFETIHKLLSDLQERVCEWLCPTTWKTGTPQPHSAECKAVTAALS